MKPMAQTCSILLVVVLAAGCGLSQSPSSAAPAASEPRIELVGVSPDPPKVGLLDVTVRVLGPDGQPIDDQIERVRIVPEMVGMPTHTVEGAFTARGHGVYAGQADVSALGGTWQLKVVAELKDGSTIQQTFEIVVQY